MASCLVTVSGTSGSVLIKYVDSSAVAHRVISDITTSLYIKDGGTNYTYTTLSGDAIASSLCITINELPTNHYIISWENVRSVPQRYIGQKFDAVILGSTTTSIDTSMYPFDPTLKIINNINTLNLEDFKITGYKIVTPTNSTDPFKYYLIVQVLGTDIPYIRINNTNNTMPLYLKGVYTATALPAGYTAVNTCQIGSGLA